MANNKNSKKPENVKKEVKKTAPKKAPVKKEAVKKEAPKKQTVKEEVAKKEVAKVEVNKKAPVKQVPAKKTTAKKATTKPASKPAPKKEEKVEIKKEAVKKETPKKETVKKETAKKENKKPEIKVEESKIDKAKLKAEKKEKKAKLKEERKLAKAELKAAKKANSPELNRSAISMLITTVLIVVVLLGICLVFKTLIDKVSHKNQNPIVTMEVENFGTVKIELNPKVAPNTVNNFVNLVNNGFYNGLTFHRTIPTFMIQGGDVAGDGTGNASYADLGLDKEGEYAIQGEFVLNGYNDNNLKLKRGAIAMARADYSSLGTTLAKEGYNSASSQFFIVTTDDSESSLDGQYAGFGYVIEGMEVVDAIANVDVETRESDNPELTADRPINPPVITKMTVETFGADYPLPETKEPFDYYSYLMKQYYGGSNY